MTTLSTRDSKAWAKMIAARMPFDTYGSAMGTNLARQHTGSMPEAWADVYKRDGEHITYTILSYDTPIAWVLDDGMWRVPDVYYSVTTARHIGTARYAITIAGETYDRRFPAVLKPDAVVVVRQYKNYRTPSWSWSKRLSETGDVRVLNREELDMFLSVRFPGERRYGRVATKYVTVPASVSVPAPGEDWRYVYKFEAVG